jgi:predicted secreted protein
MSFSQSITAKPGRNFILKVSDQASPTNFVTVGGIRTTSLQINNNPVDITNVASNGYRELLADAGIQQFNVQGDGIFDSQTTGAQTLFDAALAKTPIECQLISGHGDEFIGYFVPTQCQRNGSFDGVEQFSITLESTGTITHND